MTKSISLKSFSDRMRRIAVRLEDIHLTELFSFAELHSLLEASQSEIIKGYIENRIAQSKIDVEICDLGMLDIDSKGEPICRYASIRKLVNVTNWTTRTCQICRKAREEEAQIDAITGKKSKAREYGSLVVMAKKREVSEARISSLETDVGFYKRELGKRNNEVSHIPSLESKIQNQDQQIETLKASLDSKDTHITKLSEKLDHFRSYRIACPKGKGKTLGDCDICDDCFTCSVFAELRYSET